MRCDAWAKHCARSLITIAIHYGSKDDIERRIMVCSTYLPSDAEESPLPQEVSDLTRDCEADGLHLVIGCDAKTHHTVCTAHHNQLRNVECGLQAHVQKLSKVRGSRHLAGFGESGKKDQILEGF